MVDLNKKYDKPMDKSHNIIVLHHLYKHDRIHYAHLLHHLLLSLLLIHNEDMTISLLVLLRVQVPDKQDGRHEDKCRKGFFRCLVDILRNSPGALVARNRKFKLEQCLSLTNIASNLDEI